MKCVFAHMKFRVHKRICPPILVALACPCSFIMLTKTVENLQSIMSHKRIIVHATLLGGQVTPVYSSTKLNSTMQNSAFLFKLAHLMQILPQMFKGGMELSSRKLNRFVQQLFTGELHPSLEQLDPVAIWQQTDGNTQSLLGFR